MTPKQPSTTKLNLVSLTWVKTELGVARAFEAQAEISEYIHANPVNLVLVWVPVPGIRRRRLKNLCLIA